MSRQLLLVLCFAAAAGAALAPRAARAQSDAAVDEVENLFSKDEEAPKAAQPVPTEKPDAKALPDVKDVSDLGKLQAFDDVAVIQKRYLPKSQRWEFFLGPSLNLNDAFFFNFGGTARFGYYFRERYGIEAIATYLTVNQRQVTEDLLKKGVRTTSFVTPRGYYGLDFKWSPIYGKMTWRNKKITPFDLYFSGGLGTTSTNNGTNDLTLHLGTGQVFAFSKSSGFRWDFSWHVFTAKSTAGSSTGATSETSSIYHNLLMTVGWSWFFPEATYR